MTLFDKRGFSEVSRMLKYKVADAKKDTADRLCPLAFVNCGQGRWKNDFLVVEDGDMAGIFLVVDYRRFNPSKMLLLVYNMKTSEWNSREDGLESGSANSLILKYSETQAGQTHDRSGQGKTQTGTKTQTGPTND